MIYCRLKVPVTGLITGLLLLFTALTANGAKLNRYSYFNAHAAGTLTPNTTTERGAAFYNPAGTAFGPEGLQLHVSNMMTYGDYYFGRGDSVVDFEALTPLLPTVMLTWRDDDLSLFGVVFPQAGGLIDVSGDAPVFDESRQFIIDASNDSPLNPGLIVADVRFSDNRLRVFTAYLGGIAGMALKLNDEVSVAAAIKPVYSFGNVLLSGTIELFNEELGWIGLDELEDARIETETTGWDVGGIFGLHYQPDPSFSASLKFETLTRITLFNEPIEDPAGITEGQEEIQTDIPAMLNLGVSKTFNDKLNLRLNLNYYYNQFADAGTILGVNINGQLKNDWEIALGGTYPLTDSLDAGLGISYFKTGFSDEIRRSNRYSMDNFAIGSWASYAFNQRVEISASLMGQFFNEGKTNVTPATSQTPSGQTTLRTTFYILGTDLTWRF